MLVEPTDGQVGRLRRAMLLYLLLACVCVADRDWKKDAAEARSRRGIPEPVDRKPVRPRGLGQEPGSGVPPMGSRH